MGLDARGLSRKVVDIDDAAAGLPLTRLVKHPMRFLRLVLFKIMFKSYHYFHDQDPHVPSFLPVSGGKNVLDGKIVLQ